MKSITPNDLGNTVLVEACRKIDINTFLKRSSSQYRRAITEAELKVMGLVVGLATSQTPFGGVRYWFACPLCQSRVGTIFQHPLTQQIGCRKCLNLKYRKSRYKGMVEGSITGK